MKAVPFDKQSLLVGLLSLAGIALLAVIYFTPIWWVSLTAPNYPAESFPDGVRIHFQMNGVFNGCKKIEKAEIREDEALDCVHEMDTINHYVGMYPIAAGGPVERGYSQFLMTLLGLMLLGFACTRPKLRLAVLGLAFAGLGGWMYLTIYGENGFRLQNEGYVRALVSSLDKEAAGGALPVSVNPIVAALRKSLEDSGIKVELPSDSERVSEKQRLIDEIKVTYERDRAKGFVGEPWNGSALQVMSWHYRKSLGRYFNNPHEIEPRGKVLDLAIHLVFAGLILAMLLLLYGAWRNRGLFYWLMVLVPMGLPLFFLIDYAAWLWWYGHTLNDMGAFTVKPFMPTVLGDGKVAQFTTHSYPYTGFFLMLLLSVVLGLAALIRARQYKNSRANLQEI